MIARIDEARSAGDTVGGVFEVVVHGLPIGLGSYVHWDRRLDAALAAAVMSINIVKGVEFGLGFEQTRRFGSGVHDVIEGRDDGRALGPPHEQRRRPDRRRDQRRAARRPRRGQADLDAGPAAAVGRPHHRRGRSRRRTTSAATSASCRRPASSAEAMVLLTLAAFVLEKFGGDTIDDVGANLAAYRARIARRPRRRSPAGSRRRPADAASRPRPDRHGRGRLRRRRLGAAMDIVLVGLPGSGKSVVGKRLAQRHGADVHRPRRADRARGRPTDPDDLRRGRRGGLPDARATRRRGPRSRRSPTRAVRRIVATGGGAVVDPRNRWALYRGRTSVWLDGRPEVLAQRLRRSPHVRPLVAGARPDRRDPRPRRAARAVLRRGRHPRDRASPRSRRSSSGRGPPGRRLDAAPAPRPTTLLRADDADRTARHRRRDRGRRRRRRRCAASRRAAPILVSEPGAWDAVGWALADGAAPRAAGRSRRSCCRRARPPSGWRSSRARRSELARLRVERDEPIVAIGGGALGDAAGLPRGDVPARHPAHPRADDARRPDRLVDRRQDRGRPARGQEPRRRVPPAGRDRHRRRRCCATLPERQRRAALGEAVKMAALGDERLFELLERHGDGDRRAASRRSRRARRRRRARRALRLGQGRGRRRRRARTRAARRADHA